MVAQIKKTKKCRCLTNLVVKVCSGRFKKIKHCLGCKMIIGISMVISVALGCFFYLHIKKDHHHLMELVKDEAYQVSDIIRRSIKHDMLLNNRADLQQTIDDITGHDDIIKIRIIESGKIKIASDLTEINQLIDKKGEACNNCHGTLGPPQSRNNKNYRTFKNLNGQEVIGMMNPIYNEEPCYPCHGDQKKILGILDVVISLYRANIYLKADRNRVVIFLLLTFILIAVTLIFLIRYLVTIPIRELSKGTVMITEGNLDHQIPISTKDEVGDLARSFNFMTSRLRTYRKESQNWNRELENRVKSATSQLTAANKKLQESDRKKSELMMAVAHDIRAPLAAFKSCLQVVLDGYLQHDPAKEREMLQRIEARIEDQLTFVNKLLDFSPIAINSKEMKKINFHEVIQKVVDFMSQLAKTKKIDIEIQKDAEELSILGEEELLIRALTNLIGNSIKYSPSGSRIWITNHCNNGNIELMVRDNGVGIPKDELPNIFEVLFRGQNAKNQKEHGAGLGLSIVKEVIEIHHGKIWVESKESEGTTFFLTLPRISN